MKNSKYILLLLLFSANASPELPFAIDKAPFKKVVLWGHKLHSGTHSYIHYAFYKTFKYLGYDTYWFNANDDVANFDFSGSLFITEGNAHTNIPLRNDCRYILHNCDCTKYKKLWDANQCIILQVYTHDVLPRPVIKADDCIYYQDDIKTVYMPWATDLLPHEIDEIKKDMPSARKEEVIYWVGTIWAGDDGNRSKINPFVQACQQNGIKFRQLSLLSADQNINFIQRSYMAPALQGKWQCEVGYIPCRIFKNISYGQMGVTNSKTVYELFKGKIVYNEDPYQLFFDAQERIKNLDHKELFELMDFVKEKHTYLNRIYHLLEFMHHIKPLQ
jgi:hypothetical protein